MNRELSSCYETLGVVEGASAQELKVAYRDLAKVWHPDRFAHDPRLQQKAQEKLKEINEAYEQLTSGRIRFQKRTSSRAPAHTQQNNSRSTWRLAVLPVCVFAVVLLISGSLLIARRAPASQTQAPHTPAQEVKGDNADRTLSDGASVGVGEGRRTGRKGGPRQLPGKALKEPMVERAAAVTSTPPPTATLTIDPTTGLIATRHCPLKSRMTYADGTEPRQLCSLHKPDASATADPSPKESRLKSLTKRLASPAGWFRGKEKSVSAERDNPESNKTIKQN